MLKRPFILTLAAVALLGGCASVRGPVTVADTLAARPQLSTLNSLVNKAGLGDTLKGAGPFTVFAPTNEAFAKVPAKTMEALASDPALLATIATDSAVRLPPYTMLNPTTWALEAADGPRFISALRDQGYGLAAALTSPEIPLSERDLRTLLVAANVLFALGSAQGWDHRVSEALLERVRRTLPSNARAEAERTLQALLELLRLTPDR